MIIIKLASCGDLVTGVFLLKRYLTFIFLMLSILILSIGLRTNLQFKGIISWGLAFICLSFATYFTKYIPNDSERKRNSLKEE